MELDKLLNELNPWGRFQKLHILLLFLSTVFRAAANLSIVFITDIPEFTCSDIDANTTTSHGSSNMSRRASSDECFVVGDEEGGNQSSSNIACTGWHFSGQYYRSTIVTEWDLVCSDAYKRTLAQSMFLVGFLIGSSIFGWISDRYGRRTAWTASSVLGGLNVLGGAFMPNYWAFLTLRTMYGMCAIGATIAAWVLIMEMVSVKHRNMLGVVFMLSFPIGGILVTGIAYIVRDHVWIQVANAVTILLSLPFCWLISESPRWLISQGRLKEAETVLARMARMNGRKLPAEPLAINPLITEKKHAFEEHDSGTAEINKKYSALVLFRSCVRALATLNILLYWVVVTAVFYGLTYGATRLAASPYLMVLISYVVEALGYSMNFAINKTGRRVGLAGFMLASGLAVLAVAVIPDRLPWIAITFFMTGKMFVSAAFVTIYTYSAEFYPTVIRSVGVGTGSTCARVGGLLAPFVTDFGILVWTPLPQVIFGGLAILSGLAILFMPETLGRKLPDTIAEGDELAREMLVCVSRSRSSENGGRMRRDNEKTADITEGTIANNDLSHTVM